ncbi:MAG: NAD(P)H-hydrate dehydratase [Myxococcota bacterium]
MISDRWPLVDAATMRGLDRHTIETLGVPGELLMESAGRAVVDAVLALRPRDTPVLVACGSGNNGGDGLVAARHLHALGVPVRVALLVDPNELRGDPAANWSRLVAAGVPWEGGRFRVPEAALVVDAVFGTGLSRPVAGRAAEALERLGQTRGRTVAVDVPSGVCADTGRVLGVAVSADVTVTLGLPKLGLTLEPGRQHAGRIVVARIGIADEAPNLVPRSFMLSRAGAGGLLPARPAAAHKGSFGHVLVVAGSEGKTGAAALAAAGAVRGGAGLVTVACPASLNPILEVKTTEAMTVPVPETDERAFANNAQEAVLALAAERDVVALGPGLGRSLETQSFVRDLAKRVERPLVLDADALVALAEDPAALRARRAATILTPHPGEAARLLGTSASEVNGDRPAWARRLAERTGAVTLLKGAASLVAQPDGELTVTPTGGPALGTGGSGDVLTGLVAALLAQGLPAAPAAALAAYVHGACADRIAARRGRSGLAAQELAEEIPATMEELRTVVARRTETQALALPFPEPR